jgi:hypothetical protein
LRLNGKSIPFIVADFNAPLAKGLQHAFPAWGSPRVDYLLTRALTALLTGIGVANIY